MAEEILSINEKTGNLEIGQVLRFNSLSFSKGGIVDSMKKEAFEKNLQKLQKMIEDGKIYPSDFIDINPDYSLILDYPIILFKEKYSEILILSLICQEILNSFGKSFFKSEGISFKEKDNITTIIYQLLSYPNYIIWALKNDSFLKNIQFLMPADQILEILSSFLKDNDKYKIVKTIYENLPKEDIVDKPIDGKSYKYIKFQLGQKLQEKEIERKREKKEWVWKIIFGIVGTVIGTFLTKIIDLVFN